MLLVLLLFVAFKRYAGEKSWYALFLLHPKMHELRKVLRSPVTFGYELHPHAFILARRLKDESCIQVKLRCDTDLTIRVERKFDTQNGCYRFLEFFRLGREYLWAS